MKNIENQKNIRILYLKDEISQNTKFINFLKKEYKTDVYNCVLPNIYAAKFGDLNLDPSAENIYRSRWGYVIESNKSQEDIIYEFGLDSLSEFTETRGYNFKLSFSNYLKNLNFKFNSKSKVKDIVLSIKNSKKFIRESELKNYEIIIIEKLATAVFDELLPKKLLKEFKLDKIINDSPSYIKYKITPNLINKLLNSNIKILHLMDYDDTIMSWSCENLTNYSHILERIGLASFSTSLDFPKENQYSKKKLIVGIDFENRIKNNISEFSIKTDDSYRKKISEINLSFYSDVDRINTNFPIQLCFNSSYKIQEKNKNILHGNNETTKLYPDWDNSLFDGFSKNFSGIIKALKHQIKTYNELEKDILMKYISIEKSELEEDSLLKYLTYDKIKIDEEILFKYSSLIKNEFAKKILLNYLIIRKNTIKKRSQKIFTKIKKFEEKILSEYLSVKKKLQDKDGLLKSSNISGIRNLEVLKSYSVFEDELIFLDNSINSDTMFGITDISENKYTVTLSGNISCDKYFVDPAISNKNFIKNVIEYLIDISKNNPITNVEYLPKIKIDINLGEIFVDNIKIELKKIEFCYYLFFAERAKNGESYFSVLDNKNLEFNVYVDEIMKTHNLEGRMSPLIIEKIITYYEKSFEGNDSIKRLKDMYKLKKTPLYTQTFLSYFSKINKELTSSLAKTLPENQLSRVTISKQGNNELAKFGINLPSTNIEIIS